jgi:hypothetical protein
LQPPEFEVGGLQYISNPQNFIRTPPHHHDNPPLFDTELRQCMYVRSSLPLQYMCIWSLTCLRQVAQCAGFTQCSALLLPHAIYSISIEILTCTCRRQIFFQLFTRDEMCRPHALHARTGHALICACVHLIIKA